MGKKIKNQPPNCPRLTNPQIAAKLFISLHTVDSHRKNLLTKFGVNNTAGLIRMAAKYSMV